MPLKVGRTMLNRRKIVSGAAVIAAAAMLIVFGSRDGVRDDSGSVSRGSKPESAESPDNTTIPAGANRGVQQFMITHPEKPGSTPDVEDDEEDDSEVFHDAGLAKTFVFGTPPPLSQGGGPAGVVVHDSSVRPSPAAASRLIDDDEDEESRNTSASAELEALRELEDLGRGGSGLIGGIRVRGTSADEGKTEALNDEVDNEDEDSGLLSRVSGQARGFLILPLMHPRARESVEKQIEILLRSQVSDLYIGFLVDGSFSTDFEYASSVVQRLSSDGRSLLLELFFTNGATQRRWENTTIGAPFTMIDPEYFRYLIQEDPETQAEFRRIVNAARPLFVQNRNAGPNNSNMACMMLEDNLDVTSYRKMKEIAEASLAGIATYVRNPCPGCYRGGGSDSDTDGDALEVHKPDLLGTLGSRDGLSLDGEGYNYPGESAGGRLSIEQVKALAGRAVSQGIRYFALWRMDRQGLGDQSIHPDDRLYAVPTEEQSQMDVEILREGLR